MTANSSIERTDHNDASRSEWRVDWADKLLARKVGKKAAGRLLDGRTHDEVPS